MEQPRKISILIIVSFAILMATVIGCTYLIIKNYGQGNIIIKTNSTAGTPTTVSSPGKVNQEKTYQQVIIEQQQKAKEIRQKLFEDKP